MRFSLSKLLLAVAMVALACAAMTVRNHWWADAIVTITVLLYVVMALRAIGLRGRDRVFAIVFAIVGLSYLVLMTTDAFRTIRTSIPTKYPLGVAWKWLTNPKMPVQNNPFRPTVTESEEAPLEYIVARAESSNIADGMFFLVGHCVWSWILALLAGWFAVRMYGRRDLLHNT
jgi:hypothetical protein